MARFAHSRKIQDFMKTASYAEYAIRGRDLKSVQHQHDWGIEYLEGHQAILCRVNPEDLKSQLTVQNQ